MPGAAKRHAASILSSPFAPPLLLSPCRRSGGLAPCPSVTWGRTRLAWRRPWLYWWQQRRGAGRRKQRRGRHQRSSCWCCKRAWCEGPASLQFRQPPAQLMSEGGSLGAAPGQQQPAHGPRIATAPVAAPVPSAAAAMASQLWPAAAAALSGISTSPDSWECRRFEVDGLAVELRQDLKGSNALRPLDDERPGAGGGRGGEADTPLILTGNGRMQPLASWGVHCESVAPACIATRTVAAACQRLLEPSQLLPAQPTSQPWTLLPSPQPRT